MMGEEKESQAIADENELCIKFCILRQFRVCLS